DAQEVRVRGHVIFSGMISALILRRARSARLEGWGRPHASRRRLSPPPQHEAEYRPCGRRHAKHDAGPATPRGRRRFQDTIREGNDAQLTLSAATAARWPLISRTTTLAPTWTRLWRSITSSLTKRMPPDDTWPPMVEGSLVPWMR